MVCTKKIQYNNNRFPSFFGILCEVLIFSFSSYFAHFLDFSVPSNKLLATLPINLMSCLWFESQIWWFCSFFQTIINANTCVTDNHNFIMSRRMLSCVFWIGQCYKIEKPHFCIFSAWRNSSVSVLIFNVFLNSNNLYCTIFILGVRWI